jgi:hypothetical protein
MAAAYIWRTASTGTAPGGAQVAAEAGPAPKASAATNIKRIGGKTTTPPPVLSTKEP